MAAKASDAVEAGTLVPATAPKKVARPRTAPKAPRDILDIISHAASDPGTDVEKFKSMMGVYKELLADRARVAYAAALSQLQQELPLISERGTITGPSNSPYALWEDIVGQITPILAKHGFSLSFRFPVGDPGKIGVTGILSHREGHSEETTLWLPADTTGAKNAVQAVGSSASYGQRYTARALLNLRTGETDDDGRSAGANAPELIGPSQAADLWAMLKDTGSDVPKFLKYIGVARIEDIPAKSYKEVIALVQAKGKRNG